MRKTLALVMAATFMTAAGVTGTSAAEMPPSNGQGQVGPTQWQTTYGKRNDTRVFGGLRWNFGTMAPEIVVGLRFTETRKSNNVVGVKTDLAVPIRADMTSIRPALRVLGVAGNRDVQGEAGFGIEAISWNPILAGGVQGPYTAGGLNFVFGQGLQPYLEINTLSKPKKRREIWTPVPGAPAGPPPNDNGSPNGVEDPT